ncbi:MAG: CPBP family intramembrane glutamic endopeptidase [Planctomycetota bacterium]
MKPPMAGSSSNDTRSYFESAASPLHALVFLAPMLIFYEVSVVASQFGEPGSVRGVEAHRIFSELFGGFGVVGGRLPAVALVLTMLVMHVRRRDRWRVRPGVLVGMGIESVALTLPLLMLNAVVGSMRRAPGASDVAAAGVPTTPDLSSLPWLDQLTISVGAGLYEEFLFRLVLLASFTTLLAGAAGMQRAGGRGVAIALSAIAFAWYHEAAAGVAGVDWYLFVFYAIAGVYFSLVYLWRGFGVAAGVHGMYDIIVLVLLPRW